MYPAVLLMYFISAAVILLAIKRTIVIIRGISILPTMYKIVSNIQLSRLTPHPEEITGDHKCGIRRNRSPTDRTFCIRQILETKWEYHEAGHQLFTDIKKAYDSLGREILYNILI